MKLSNNFTLEEFVASATARSQGINNEPPPVVVESLTHLVVNLLQPLRGAYGQPLQINSGYRCPELNRAVGGVATSQHVNGQAADVRCTDPCELLRVLRKLNLDFDQAILYPTFLHLSLKKEANRRQIIKK